MQSKNIKCPTVMHFADKDQFVPVAAIEQIKAHFAGRPEIEIYVYHGQDHAFARTGGDHYDKASAMTAEARTKALFRGPRIGRAGGWGTPHNQPGLFYPGQHSTI